ncbi:sensor histidine kinase [Pedobacter metabolipauper]|uniref:Histidine kinase n=1 Tax=Pedobacter metabolipauper TaxID=425513 RepID=A0A4R6SRP6_9SPHI|nr:histidine kinase [Pedobacter metabolipauper]TDQ06904.1 histidine kinase [Pedobacter metabolipauper]
MVAIKSRSYITVLLHTLLWMLFAFILLFYQPLSWDIALPYQFWVKQSCILMLLVFIFYLNSTIFVPQLLMKNRNLVFVLIIFGISLLAGPLVKVVDEALNLPELMQQSFSKAGFQRPPRRGDRLDLFLLMMTLLIVGISTSVTLIQRWQTNKQEGEALEKEKIASELSFLKAQINPHFFFNTLNNIYALTHIDIETSRMALHKLSRMMRYLLYDTQAGITPLSKEVFFIVDYIELMKLRLNEFTEVTFNEPIVQSDVQIAPMLFLPYIENAFKHGVSTTEPSHIFIHLALDGNRLKMTVKNAIFNAHAATADEYGGIGLMNTKRRLDLLYPGKHSFSAHHAKDTNEFIVQLEIVLDDN